jgi:hypothetical protein
LSKPNFLKSPNNKAKKFRALGGGGLSKPNFLSSPKKQSHKLSGLWEVCLPPNFPFPGLTNSFAFTDLLLVADGKVDVPKTTFVKMNSSFEIKVKTTYEFLNFE